MDKLAAEVLLTAQPIASSLTVTQGLIFTNAYVQFSYCVSDYTNSIEIYAKQGIAEPNIYNRPLLGTPS